MKLTALLTKLFGTAALLGVLMRVPSVQAVTLDWDTLSWTPGSLSQSFDVDPAFAGNDVTITISGTTSAFSGYPQITQALTGGLSPAQSGLELNLDFVSRADTITVTVTFSANYVYGVDNIVFNLFDVDRTSNTAFIDEISNIHARPGLGTYVGPASTTNGSANTVTGAGTSTVVTGTGVAADNGGTGNTELNFGINAVTEFAFTFGNNSGARGNPAAQSIMFADFSFQPKPIPEVHPGLAAVLLCTVMVGTRKLRLRAARAS